MTTKTCTQTFLSLRCHFQGPEKAKRVCDAPPKRSGSTGPEQEPLLIFGGVMSRDVAAGHASSPDRLPMCSLALLTAALQLVLMLARLTVLPA